MRWAALLHDVGQPDVRAERDGNGTFHGHERVSAERADQVHRRLEFAPADREHNVHLVREHLFGFRADASDVAVRRWLVRMVVDRVADRFDLRITDTMGNGARAGSPAQLDAFRDRIERVRAGGDAPSGVELAVNGDDVLALTGRAPGPVVGALLRRLRAEVAERPERNMREHLLARIRACAEPRDEAGTP